MTTNFWVDHWIDNFPLKFLAVCSILENIQSFTVAQMWSPAGWNWELIHSCLNDEAYLLLELVSLVPDLDGMDEVAWQFSTNGVFSVRLYGE